MPEFSIIMNVYWLEQNESDVPLSDEWLSAAELARLELIRFPKRRADWRLGRWTAKCAISAYLNAPADHATFPRITISAAASGAPQVMLAENAAGISISLSHTAGTAACAIAESESALGCDIEAIEPRSESFIADYFTLEEREFLASSPESRTMHLVNTMWSAKESALKALQEGLRLDTRSVAVALDQRRSRVESGWGPLQVTAANAVVFYGWYQTGQSIVRTLVGSPKPEVPTMLIVPARKMKNSA